MDFFCKKCNSRGFYLQEKGPNTGVYCDTCGTWGKWVSKKELPLLRRKGISVLPSNAVVKLKGSMDIGIDKVEHIKEMPPVNLGVEPFGGISEQDYVQSEKDIEFEVERRVAERMQAMENIPKTSKIPEITNRVGELEEKEGFCPICEGTPLESEGQSRVEVCIYSGVMTISDPEGFNIYGLYKLKRCPFCGKLF